MPPSVSRGRDMKRRIIQDDAWRACLADGYKAFAHEKTPVTKRKAKIVQYANAVWCMKACYSDFKARKDSRQVARI